MQPVVTQSEGGTVQNDLFAVLLQLIALINPVKLTGATDALDPHNSATYVPSIATGVDAMTLAAPTKDVDDGKIIIITSGSAEAHTLTATNLLNTGGTAVSLLTFAAHAGATAILMAYQGKWQVLSVQNVTISS